MVASPLHILQRSADFELVDDRHDRRVDRAVPGYLGLARARARRVEHHLTHPRAYGVDRHHERRGGLALQVHSAHHEELQPLELWFFARGDDCAYHLADQHGWSGAPRLGLGLVGTTEREDEV